MGRSPGRRRFGRLSRRRSNRPRRRRLGRRTGLAGGSQHPHQRHRPALHQRLLEPARHLGPRPAGRFDPHVDGPAAAQAHLEGVVVGDAEGDQPRPSRGQHLLGHLDHGRLHAAARHRAGDLAPLADGHRGARVARRLADHLDHGGQGHVPAGVEPLDDTVQDVAHVPSPPRPWARPRLRTARRDSPVAGAGGPRPERRQDGTGPSGARPRVVRPPPRTAPRQAGPARDLARSSSMVPPQGGGRSEGLGSGTGRLAVQGAPRIAPRDVPRYGGADATLLWSPGRGHAGRNRSPGTGAAGFPGERSGRPGGMGSGRRAAAVPRRPGGPADPGTGGRGGSHDCRRTPSRRRDRVPGSSMSAVPLRPPRVRRPQPEGFPGRWASSWPPTP